MIFFKKPKDKQQSILSDGILIPGKDNNLAVFVWRFTFIAALAMLIGLAIRHPDPYWEILTFLPDGILTTFKVTIFAIIFAFCIGLLVGFGQIVRSKILNSISMIYIEVIRGIPLLVQLFYIYFALGKFLNIQGITAAVSAMAICYGAYIGEVFRAGVRSIPKGQMEAAISLGLTRRQAIIQVILPQAIKVILPAIGNEFIALLKDSSLVSVLAISDLLRRGREFASTSFLYFETYTVVALIYLLATLILSRVFAIFEKHMNKHD